MVWFVTGASSGLGLEMVRILAARGDTVLASGRRALAELPADFPDCAYLPCDLADLAAVMQLAEWVAGQGPLHAAVLSAGAGFYRPLAQETPDAMARVLATNLNANITLAHALHPVLSGGRLGLIGSVAHKGAAGMPVYAASKAALDGFGRALAEEWRGRTTVRVLHPRPGRDRYVCARRAQPPISQTACSCRRARPLPRFYPRLAPRAAQTGKTVSFLRVGLHRLVKGGGMKVLITGGASGFGAAVASACAARGDIVYVLDRVPGPGVFFTPMIWPAQTSPHGPRWRIGWPRRGRLTLWCYPPGSAPPGGSKTSRCRTITRSRQ